MSLLNELKQIVDDAQAHRSRVPQVETLDGWTKEQWAWAMLKHTLDSKHPFDLRTLTLEDALKIKAWWRSVFGVDPPTWPSQLFDRFTIQNARYLRCS